MANSIYFEWYTASMVRVVIPITKKHSIHLFIKENGMEHTSDLYPPELEIMLAGKSVTDVYIKGRTPDKVIAPTGINLKTAIDLIEEAEYRMAERREENADETITDEE